MESKILKLRKQLEYIDKLNYILCEENDGGLYRELEKEEEDFYEKVLDFTSDLEIKIEKELKKSEKKLLTNV